MAQAKDHESLVAMATTKEIDAKSLTNVIFNALEDCGLDPNRILSQYYDGASVMSGKDGGVQKLVQEKLGKYVPYVHCFNHQLHLVVTNAIGKHAEVERFFAVCSNLSKFMRRPKVSRLYEGTRLKGLLDQRWIEHCICYY